MGPVCRSESRSAPAEPTDFSWHLAVIQKDEMLIYVIITHIALCYDVNCTHWE